MNHFSARVVIVSIVFLCGISTVAQNTTGPEDGIVGTWLTEKKGGKIQMFRCGDSYCGKTVWISKTANPAGMDARDVNNPDPNKRKRKLIGATIFWNLKWDLEDKQWRDGYVYDPTRGKTFRCKAWLEDDGKTLQFRGYLGVSLLGSTTTWTLVE